MPTTTDSDSGFKDFYSHYYAAANASQANAEYSQRLFGKNLCQQGFAEISHIHHMLEITGVKSSSRVLDLGCGNGMIAEYISDLTGAFVTGIDFIPEAIEQACRRIQGKSGRLQFQVMDMSDLDFPDSTFDVLISIDTLYFTDLHSTLGQMARFLKPGGCMVIFYNQSWQPWTPIEEFDKESVHPDRTDLAVALQSLGFPYQVWDYTPLDVDHAERKEQIASELKEQFSAEGNLFLYDNHIGEARGIQKAYHAGAHGRYLYRVTL